MQHSPQEIKTKLGEAVDPDGNVLNMATLIEVVGLLERTPLTKEALEQTRIGRTVNLLRKKTNNEDIARRAKRLVKKWQKLVQNHMEAARTINSPLNGMRSNSPVANGINKSEEQVNSPACEVEQIDSKTKGTKRKRPSVDSPPLQSKVKSRDKTNLIAVKNDQITDLNDELSDKCSQDVENNHGEAQNYSKPSSCLEPDSKKHIKTNNNGNCSNHFSPVECNTKSNDENIRNKTEMRPPLVMNNVDHTDVRWEGKDVGVQTDEINERDYQNHALVNSSSLLNVDTEANGINGRYGEDGTWHPWSETMSYNEGNLIILPYVLLE